jgi:elongation of very long chain fatty acids protein 7
MIVRKAIYESVNILQVQFVLVIIHSLQLLFIDCNYPKAFVWLIVLQAVIFFSLFADFYKQAYKKKQASTVRTGILVL